VAAGDGSAVSAARAESQQWWLVLREQQSQVPLCVARSAGVATDAAVRLLRAAGVLRLL